MQNRASSPRNSTELLGERRTISTGLSGDKFTTPRHYAEAKPEGLTGPTREQSEPQTATTKLNGHTIRHSLLRSFFAGGFECSTHLRRSGYRLDLVSATKHDTFAAEDYARLAREGIRVTREGVRWHLVEQSPGQYDFSSVLPIVKAARATQTQVIWDLCHFGWPGDLDLFGTDFVPRLARYGAAFVQWLAQESDETPFIVPINEISFFSWASGEEGSMYPFAVRRGFELKRQLVRATIETIKAIRAVAPQARFVQVDPIIHVVASPKHPEEASEAEAYRESQYQAFDMLCGRLDPELGGADEFLDVIGVNFYPHNQWIYNLKNTRRIRKFQTVNRRNPLYRPFREMLLEIYRRYERPMFIAETGAEDRRRAGWFSYVCEQAQQAMSAGVPLEGICLYPILNHPGWLDDRHCHNGLWDYPDENGDRKIYQPLARELRKWRKVFGRSESPGPGRTQKESSNAAANP